MLTTRHLRRLKSVTGVGLLALLATALLPLGAAQAVINGVAPGATPPWNAVIKISYKGNNYLCSGELVAEQWVLTAAHCVHPEDKNGNPIPDTLFPASAFTILIGKATATDRAGYTTRVDQDPTSQAVGVDKYGHALNDVGLLHLATPAPVSLAPLPLRMSTSVVPNGSQVSLFGWGRTNSSPTSAGQKLLQTRNGDFALNDACFANGLECYDPSTRAVSYGFPGDSGAPVVSLQRGTWVEAGIHTGPPRLTTQYGASTLLYSAWIRSKAGLPTVPPNNILRDSATGTSYFLASDGFMKWIPTGGIYNCFVSKGARVYNMTRYQTLSFPQDHTANAACGTTTGGGGGGSGAGSGGISIGWSTAHPTWISMSVSGFQAGSYAYTCNFGSGGNQSYTVALTGSPQTFDNGHTCYDGIRGDTVWVTIGSAKSNVLTVGGSASPPPAATHAETVGGVAHTWTNYTNAGGTEGPAIPALATVQVSCALEGFRVADGDAWWYRVASSPWTNAYYVSADAFYNNGATSGSLHGTPFVDTAVPRC